MKAKKLLAEISEFHSNLKEHQKIWGESLDDTIPDFPYKNQNIIREQIENLNETIGWLRPYLLKYRNNWVTRDGVDVLDAAIGNHHAIIKGRSLISAIDLIGQIIGQLKHTNSEKDIAISDELDETGKPKKQINLESFINSFHPQIITICKGLFLDGHYTQAIEESVKAVFEYLRKRTGLKGDGASIIDTIFSTNKPVLSFGDLSEQIIKDKQVGFMQILKGYYMGVRSPLSHSHGNEAESTEAFEFMAMASVLCRQIDKMKKVRKEG